MTVLRPKDHIREFRQHPTEALTRLACIPVWAPIAAIRIIFPSGWALRPLPNTWLEIGQIAKSASRSLAISIAIGQVMSVFGSERKHEFGAPASPFRESGRRWKLFMKAPKTFA